MNWIKKKSLPLAIYLLLTSSVIAIYGYIKIISITVEGEKQRSLFDYEHNSLLLITILPYLLFSVVLILFARTKYRGYSSFSGFLASLFGLFITYLSYFASCSPSLYKVNWYFCMSYTLLFAPISIGVALLIFFIIVWLFFAFCIKNKMDAA